MIESGVYKRGELEIPKVIGEILSKGLKNIGSAAAEAVPALIQALEDECASEIEHVCDVERNAIVRALRAITGQDFAEDASAWREWWEEQQ